MTIYFLLLFFLSASISFVVNLNVIDISIKKKLFDVPNETRKLHKFATPNLGGIGIYISFIIMLQFIVFNNHNKIPVEIFLVASLMIFLIGLKDDLIGISPIKKLISQIFAAFIIVYFTDIRIENLGGFLNVFLIPAEFSFIITIFYIVFICNSLNLIDGINGLAGSISIFISSIIAFYFYNSGEMYWAAMVFVLIGGVSGFLILNFGNAKIFMGDTGSYFIGLMLSIFSIKIINNENNYLLNNSNLSIVLSIFIIPVYDTLRVIVLRIVNSKNPFKADKNHLHHLIHKKINNHRYITLILLSVNIIIYFFCILFINIGNNYLILLEVLLMSFFSYIVNIISKK